MTIGVIWLAKAPYEIRKYFFGKSIRWLWYKFHEFDSELCILLHLPLPKFLWFYVVAVVDCYAICAKIASLENINMVIWYLEPWMVASSMSEMALVCWAVELFLQKLSPSFRFYNCLTTAINWFKEICAYIDISLGVFCYVRAFY